MNLIPPPIINSAAIVPAIVMRIIAQTGKGLSSLLSGSGLGFGSGFGSGSGSTPPYALKI